jgi:hypothetical protein
MALALDLNLEKDMPGSIARLAYLLAIGAGPSLVSRRRS